MTSPRRLCLALTIGLVALVASGAKPPVLAGRPKGPRGLPPRVLSAVGGKALGRRVASVDISAQVIWRADAADWSGEATVRWRLLSGEKYPLDLKRSFRGVPRTESADMRWTRGAVGRGFSAWTAMARGASRLTAQEAGTSLVDGREVTDIRVVLGIPEPVTLRVDAKTYLPVAILLPPMPEDVRPTPTVPAPAGPPRGVRVEFEDYREVQGLMLPHKVWYFAGDEFVERWIVEKIAISFVDPTASPTDAPPPGPS